MSADRKRYEVQVAGLTRRLPIFEVAPGVRIAVLNILGDNELVRAGARALLDQLSAVNYKLFVTPEAKSIPLAYELSRQSGKRYVVLRKQYRKYMGETISAETVSITTGEPQTLHLDEKDRALVKGERVVLVDDVVSTGSTLKGMRQVMEKAQANISAEAAIFTEGDPSQWEDILALGHLPVFTDD
ncbi:MAG: phosphoribosyltransferase family protein [Anaerolineales bacterium]